jgi:hypothetical protein
MRPSNIGGQYLAGAGDMQHRSGHRIVDPVAMRLGDRQPVRIDRRLRLDAVFLDVAVGQNHVNGLGFLRGGGGSGVIQPDQRAVDDAALRGAGAGTGGKRFQYPGGAAGGGGGKLVVGDIDGPGALADGNAGQGRFIARIELALRQRRTRQQQRRQHHAGGEPQQRPQGKPGRPGRNHAAWGH